MGLNFSYLLYFKQDHLLDALQGLERIAEVINPPITKYFPDYPKFILLKSNDSKDKQILHTNPEMDFATVLNFDADEEIQDYMINRGSDDPDRGPPDPDETNQVAIGYIYLTIFNNLASQAPENNLPDDLVLFEFGTTGTRMSLLFDNSTSIRKTFLRLLKNNQGVCGVFNREVDWPELFWLKGKQYSKSISSAYMLPEEIEDELMKGW